MVARFPVATESDELIGACAGGSNYVAEMEVISNAVHHTEQCIEEGTAAPANVTHRLTFLPTFSRELIDVAYPTGKKKQWHVCQTHSMQWIPSHCRIKGNEKFGEALNSLRPTRGDAIILDLKARICERIKSKWYESLDRSTGLEVWRVLKRPNINWKDEWGQLVRKDQTILARFMLSSHMGVS